MENNITITDFKPEHASAFRDLNYEWLNKYFEVEPHDEEILSDPYHFILAPGGAIIMALDGDEPIGTVALLPRPNNELELAKMAVTEKYQGQGVGKQLIDAAIAKAGLMGANKLMLVSNRQLTPALTLYASRGFIEVENDVKEYERCDIQMELLL